MALAYVRARVADREAASPAPEPLARAGVLAAMDGLVRSADLAELTHRQTAVLIRPGKADRLIPLYREVAISSAVLDARIAGAGQAAADPFLFSHLAAQLDRRMLTALQADIPSRGPLSGGLDVAALHVNLTLAGILSDGFSSFAEACQPAIDKGLRVAIEVPFVEVFAEPKGFVLARERLKLARLRTVLDGLSAQALLVSRPAVLKPHLVKLNWSQAVRDGGAELRAAIEGLGVERVVLHRCEDEVALAWGLGMGIQRFQGHFVDAMLATERMQACRHSSGCNLRQCRERASAAGLASRAGCFNLGLLDLAVPLRAGSLQAGPMQAGPLQAGPLQGGPGKPALAA